MKPVNRKQFLQLSAGLAATAFLPRSPLFGATRSTHSAAPLVDASAWDRSALRDIALAAIDAAKARGATYADVVIHQTQSRQILMSDNGVELSIGVRALADGLWGFAGHDGNPTHDSAARLGNAAVAHARHAAVKGQPPIELVPAPLIADAHWTMPVEIDPFTIPPEEVKDFAHGVKADLVTVRPDASPEYFEIATAKKDRLFMNSEGTFVTQQLFSMNWYITLTMERHPRSQRKGEGALIYGPVSVGWEGVMRAPFEAMIRTEYEHMDRARLAKPVDIGKYPVVFDAAATASIANATFANATDLDRAMGTRANEDGTSFLEDPEAMLDTLRVASHRVNVSANRSLPGGAATVQWDDEGVAPTELMIVRDGMFTGYQTTRETASWLRPHYTRLGVSLASSGSYSRSAAGSFPALSQSNIVVHGADTPVSFDDIVADIKHGYAVIGGGTSADHQCLNVAHQPRYMYEIRNGKVGDAIRGATFLLRTPNFWNSIVGMGAANAATPHGFHMFRQMRYAGQLSPLARTVVAVPCKAENVSVVETRYRG